MNCSVCNTPVEPGAVFCPNCGNRLDTQPQPQPNTTQQQYYVAPQGNQDAPMSLGDYMLTMLLTWIPIVGFIMLLIWSFSSDVNNNKKNYARARLIYAAIGLVLTILFIATLIPVFVSLAEGMVDWMYYY